MGYGLWVMDFSSGFYQAAEHARDLDGEITGDGL